MRLLLSEMRWRLRKPFVIARETINEVPTIVAELEDEQGFRGRGEAVGVDYAGETPGTMWTQLESIRAEIEGAPPSQHASLLKRLPVGGARNALDAALWDLQAKRTGIPAFERAGVAQPTRIPTAYTIGLGSPADVAAEAAERRRYPLLKLKVDARNHIALVDAVRAVAPDTPLIVDANGSWSADLLDALATPLSDRNVALIEQPLAPGEDHALKGRSYPFPLAADESFTDCASIDALLDCYQCFNIKLDKTGGLTEALAAARRLRALGREIMVGNMCGSSLAMAPAAVIAPLCKYVDLDGPLLQVDDVEPGLVIEDGWMRPPEAALWG